MMIHGTATGFEGAVRERIAVRTDALSGHTGGPAKMSRPLRLRVARGGPSGDSGRWARTVSTDGALAAHERGTGGETRMRTSVAVMRRGLLFGLRAGAVPAGICAVLWAAIALSGLSGEPLDSSFEKPAAGLVAVLGSLAVGAAVGLVTGAVLAVAPPRMLGSAPARGLTCFVVGATLSAGEVVVMDVSSEGGYGPVVLAVLAMPVVGAVTAARSRSIAAARLGGGAVAGYAGPGASTSAGSRSGSRSGR
ncbi:hypothetical protein [Streptomyces sp. NPDC015680]|uniref:hypothetical protein n=2 Tax=Streptomyces TaxID=1883 RepID=UPI0036FB3A47